MTWVRGGRSAPLALVFLAAFATRSAQGSDIAGGIRVDDPAYRELRLAANLGLLAGPLHQRAPLSRTEALRLLRAVPERASPADQGRGLTPSVQARLDRLRREIAPSPEAWAEGAYRGRQELTPVQGWSVRFAEMTGGPVSPRDLGFGYDDRQGLVYEEDAGFFVESGRVALDFSGRLRMDAGAITYRPLVFTLRVGWPQLQLVAGREPVRWGPNNYGNLLLSENARPLDQVRLENDSPIRLPGPLNALGEFSFSLLAGRLDDPHRHDAPNPYLAGARVSYAPCRWFVLGATRTVLLGGEGNGFVLTPESVWELLLASHEHGVGGHGNDTDQKGIVEANLYLWPLFRPLPLLDGGRLWYELGGEDSPQHGPLPATTGSTYGIEIVARGVTLRAEATALRDDRNLWYWHTVYTDGYTYRGRVMGHPAGGDSRAQSYGIDVPLGTWGLLNAGMERQEIGFYSNPGRPPAASIPPIAHGVSDVFRLALETHLDRGRLPGTFRVEVQALRTFGDAERLGPLEQWGVTLSWRR